MTAASGSEGLILTLNVGSSSIKVAVFRDAEDAPILRGQLEGIGATPHLLLLGRDGALTERHPPAVGMDHARGLAQVLEAVGERVEVGRVAAVGHRVVHGGPDLAAPVPLTAETIAALERLVPLAPLHQPHNLAGIRAARDAFPGLPQVACFDTAFHRDHPWVNDTFALPRRYYDAGVRRYGFHGLSYEYIVHALRSRYPERAAGRVVVAHLGNGASMCAIRDGKSIGSTMGFTALDGLPMGTRCGQLDPGVLLYMMDEEGLGSAEIADILYKQSGLKGLSGIGSDMRALEASEAPEAAQAIAYFVFRIRREIGAMAAILGGLDTLVFTGGIGEHAAGVRARVCEGFDWLGVELDAAANQAVAGEAEIGAGRVSVLVVPTDEELMIARHTLRVLGAAVG